MVVSKTVLRNRCDRFFRETVVPQIGVTEFGGSKTVFPKRCFPKNRFFLKRWSRKSVLPNLVISILKTVSRNRCSAFSTKTVSRILVIPKQCSQNGVSQNRCFRFFLNGGPENWYYRIWWSQKRCHEIGVPVFRNYPASYARFHQPMSASRTCVGEMDVQFLATIVSPNQDTSTLFRAAMHRALDSRLGILERQCETSSIKARSRFIFLR